MLENQRETRDHWLLIADAIILICLGLFLYGDSIKLPFFFDDVLHFWWVKGNSLWALWRGAGSLGNYRPLPFSLWKLNLLVTGTLDPVLLHSLNVIVHILNGVLVAALTRQLVRDQFRRLTGLVAGLLFVSYPFSYQAVPWVGAFCHPLVTALVLGAVLSGLLARSRSWWGWRGISLALTVAAFFTHETGLTIGGWLLGYELIYRKGETPWRTLRWPLVYLLLAVAYVPFYFSVPRAGGQIPSFSLERLTLNGAYLLQGLAFPIAPLARWTMDNWGWNDLIAAYLAAGLTLGWLTLVGWRRGTQRALAFALAAFALAIAPMWLTLSYNYVISGPRLLYLPSVGATIAWACGLNALVALGRGRQRALTSGFSLLLIGLTILFGCRFVRTRQAIHNLGGALIHRVSETIPRTRKDEKLLVVNYPAWLAPDRPVYPIGHEGVEFMPGYTNVADLAWVNTGMRREVQAVKFANTLVPLPDLYYGVRGSHIGWEDLAERLRAADRVYTVHYTPTALAWLYAGRLAEASSTHTAPVAVFDNRVTLVAAKAVPTADGTLALRLNWEADGPLTDAVYSVFAHLYDASGTLVTQSDGYPMDGLYPFWLWRSGEPIEEMRYLTPPGRPFSGQYQVAVGIYNRDTGERLAAYGPDEARIAGDVVPVSSFRW
jgi:hypothetical protein